MTGVKTLRAVLAGAALVIAGGPPLATQEGRGQGPAAGPAPSAQAAAPIDMTGYWVSIVSEDWRWRMVTPARGDYQSVPLNAEGRRVADAWDPARDDAAGEACRSYGAPAIMRVPGRLHITWRDDNTLQVDIDAGMQTRLLHFGDWKAPGGEPTWQGDSVASWEVPRRGGRGGPAAGGGTSAAPRFGSLKVVTTHIRPGYLRKNGVPYSADTRMTEYWDVLPQPNGSEYLVVTTIIEDPTYLTIPWIVSPNFKREPNGSKWDPTPCSATW